MTVAKPPCVAEVWDVYRGHQCPFQGRYDIRTTHGDIRLCGVHERSLEAGGQWVYLDADTTFFLKPSHVLGGKS